MPLPSLLNIDPDKLFEESSIPEIEEVQRKLQNEIERKREELRTMVGERYRDLIEAADTISLMKTLSEKVIEDVNKIKLSTAELQEQQVSGFKIEYQQRNVSNNLWACVAAQIKVLVDISEVIWEAVDELDFTKASLLFLMARYIKTTLEINPNFKTGKYFPVVSRQWSSIVHFKDTIIRGAEESLKSQILSEPSCSGLLSLALLQNLTASQLLERYLSLRSAALHDVLSPKQSLDAAAIKERLCHSYTLLVHSIVVIYHCFLEHTQAKEGLLWKELQNHVGSQSLPTIQLLDQETCDIPMALLPPAIKQFRPVVEQQVEQLPEAQVVEAISAWLKWVRAEVAEHGGQLLQRLSSLRSLHTVRDPPQVMCEEWPLVTQKLQIPELWSELYRSLLTERAQQLVSVHWDSALKAIQHQIRKAVDAASQESKQTEVDLMWYMWKESTTDLSNLNDLKSTKGLWLKARGVTVRVAELSGALELKICSLLGDLASLCPDLDLDPTLLAISHTLKAHQQTVCANLITRLVKFVKELMQTMKSEAAVMLLAKFLQSIPELCPSLSKCLSSVDTKSVSWQESQALIQTECLTIYRAWLSLASVRVLKQVTDTLGSVVPHLHSIPQWEEIYIEEEGEVGEKLQSVLKVPCSTSLNLQNALHHLASAVGHVAIPKQISEKLADSVICHVVDLYKKAVNQSLAQTQYLQMLLDVKYLAHLFSSNSNKDMKTKFQETISNIESKIDPFDLNVFTPYINENVKVTVHRTQALLGTVGTAPALMVAPSPRSEEPSLLALSSAANLWFPLLHITTPRVSNPPAKPKGKKTGHSPSPSVVSATTDPGMKQSSSASSFFGVMASDWFG